MTLPEANSTQDVGVFLRGSDSDARGTGEFRGFSVREPLSASELARTSTATPTPTSSGTDTDPPYEFGEQGYGEYGYGGYLL